MGNIVQVAVLNAHVKAGDKLVQENGEGWTALADADIADDGTITLGVQYADGGTGERTWETTRELTVERMT